MSFRQTAGFPPIMSLHRYWMHANRMRKYFEAALTQSPPDTKQTDQRKAILAAVSFIATDPGLFMSYWYGSLYVVIEGWKQLKLSDPKIDSLLTSPNVRLLKEYRNGVFHFQKNYFDDRFVGFMGAKNSADWVRNVHSEFGKYFLRRNRSSSPSAAGSHGNPQK